MTVPDTSDYEATFALVDTDDDDLISAEEVKHLMEALGEEITDETATEVVELMDGDGDGKISLEEFTGYMSRS